MRVLLISDVYFPRVNGVSTSIRTFRQDLAAHGVDARSWSSSAIAGRLTELYGTLRGAPGAAGVAA